MSQSLATYNDNRVYSTRSCRQQCFYGNATTENVLATTVSGDGHEVAQDFTLNYDNSSRLHNYKILQQRIIGQTIQSVEDIEKWLRYTSEHISNSESNVKSNVRAGLSEQLSGVPDKELLTDIELTARKLNIDYDAILSELQTNRAMSTSEKNAEFILADVRLDNLIPTQEISDSSSQYESDSSTDKSQQSMGDTVDNTVETVWLKNEIKSIDLDQQLINNETEMTSNVDATLMCIQDLSIETDSSDGSLDPNQCTNSENKPYSNNKSENLNSLVVEQQKTKRYNTRSRSTNLPSVKSKFEPSIIKRKRKVKSQEIAVETEESNRVSVKSVLQEKSLNKNISTRRRKSPKSSTSESSGSESDGLGKGRSYATAQELIVSNALEAAGIKESSLEYFYNSQNVKKWRCHLPNCARHFAQLCYLKVHLMGHMNIKPFKCDVSGCSWAFYSEFKLKRHKEAHLNKKDYVCNVAGCERRFTTIYNLTSHEKLHSRPNKIACQVSGCTAKFPTKRALENHMKCHDESLAPYVCNYGVCGKRFYSSNALMSHHRRHSYTLEELTCSWPGCGKFFDLPCRKKAHMHYHTGQKPFACTYEGCGWAFPTSSKLKRHQKKHTKERSFPCKEEGCRKAFMRLEHLRDHKLVCARQRLNSAIANFKCEFCNSRFAAKASLYTHIKKHMEKECENTIGRVIARHPENKNSVGSSGSESTSAEETENIALANMPVANVVLHKMYKCPVEACSKWYSHRSSLRLHSHRKHNSVPLSEIQNLEEDEDEESVDDPSLPNEGAARTGFTLEYVLSMKPDRQVLRSNEVGTIELTEGLLRDQGLPSVFCQENEDSAACQMLLLDNSVDVLQALD